MYVQIWREYDMSKENSSTDHDSFMGIVVGHEQERHAVHIWLLATKPATQGSFRRSSLGVLPSSSSLGMN